MLRESREAQTNVQQEGLSKLAKMAKFVYKNTCPSVANYQSQSI